jgi:hypothetical protein
MTDEELAGLMQEISEAIEGLPESDEKPLTRRERRHKLVLRARKQALEKLKEAREKGNINGETKAVLDYAVLTEYGEKNIFLYNFMRARMSLWRVI